MKPRSLSLDEALAAHRGEPPAHYARRTRQDLHAEYAAAEAAWSAEGYRVFGERWGDVRYTRTAHGEQGTELRRLYAEYECVRIQWDAAPIRPWPMSAPSIYNDPSGTSALHVGVLPHELSPAAELDAAARLAEMDHLTDAELAP